MNARTSTFNLTVEPSQIEESVLSIFHTLLVHRTIGKFDYKAEKMFCVGCIGTQDIDCEFIDLTYVRVNCDDMIHGLRQEVLAFRDSLRQKDSMRNGKISLEFYQRHKRNWSVTDSAWEIWTIDLEIAETSCDADSQKLSKEMTGEAVSEVILNVCEMMNRGEYVPQMPAQSEIGNVFDVHHADVQPYLYRVTYQTTGPSSGLSVTSTVKKLIKDTLSL